MSNNTYCAALWHSIFYKELPTVTTRPCCVFQEVVSKSSKVEDYINNENLAKYRQQSLNGEWPDPCIRCKTKEDLGLSSDRLQENQKHGVESVDDLINAKPVIRSIEYRPGNMCNLKCRMCMPSDSYLIQKEIQQYPEILKDKYRHDHYNEELHEFYRSYDPNEVELNYNLLSEDLIKNIHELKVIGGEPSIDKNIHSVLEWIIEKNYSKNIKLKYTTNVTNANKKWLDYHHHFKSNRITFSLDATGKTYEYIRTPAKWKAIKQNLAIYKNEFPDAMTSINMVFSLFNCFTVDDWYNELLNECFHDDPMININHTSQPYLRPSTLPEKYKDYIANKLDRLSDSLLKTSMQRLLYIDQPKNNSANLIEFKKFALGLDKIRGTDITSLDQSYESLLSDIG